ncbi:type II secretion system protein [Methylophaga sp. OBS4]|uniref:type II secretion system protein n=1 Tax=Methylophaga sp. OBS4 TaxID=2991935 RepID=UPI00224DF180|nr:prepilin-type N-terminal cleavage/methylation domain-containing protein [Methylophaga sp. OBS4]MCX4187779.1 prepilin-type N-terminal cleavage/methylation domain-containing protein [Methylophaga sp. OBS4]
MNIKQMKTAISKFRAADISAIKDDKLRTKAKKLQGKQGGFTLLELLVVITLLATLATAALVAYEGIGENAQDTAAATNITIAESSIRNFRAVENAYPNQWDNLANLGGELTGGAFDLLADNTKDYFGQWVVDASGAGAVWSAAATALNAVGISELQTLQTTSTFNADVVPNLAFNESSPHNTADPADELEFEDGTVEYDGAAITNFAISIVPSSTDTVCTANGVSLTGTLSGNTVTDSTALNLINDALDDDGCHLVLALGFGKDVPGTTIDSRVAIAQVPTAGSTNVNPANNYARFIALYHLGSADEDGSTPTDITAADIFSKARLIGIVDPEGRNLDQVIAGANTGA